MSNTALIDTINRDLLIEIDPDGKLNLTACLQCGRCSSGCTMRLETDILPHQLNRMVALGMKDQLLASKAIWTCVSCQTCVSRCPMNVDTPALIDRLREIANSAPGDLNKVKIFNETFLASVRRYGRAHEFGLMAAYKMKTRDFFTDLAKFPAMLLKGKMKILPPFTKGRAAVAKIFDKTLQQRGPK
ncbi:MAG: 4Fe-4S dicluster domain-containing protein [Armatimonadota bacterium]|nr:4Fe-4S dicluster domain-containing protein [Armatimonadota bacterium]